MSNEAQQSGNDDIGANQVLPTAIDIPVIKGEMVQLRPARLDDLDVMESIDAYYGSSTITGRSQKAEHAVVDSWVRDSVAWSLGDVDVEATLYAHGLTRTISWTIMTNGGADEEKLQPIGMIFLTQVDAWSHSARIQVVLGRDYRGRGYSRDAMPRVMTYGFASAPVGLGLHRIWVAVPEKNTRSLSVYQSLGFTPEATLRHALWDKENDKYQDQVIMGTLADEYDPVRALDVFGMRMNPDNPGVKEALAAHSHSIEIVKESKDGTVEIRSTDVSTKSENSDNPHVMLSANEHLDNPVDSGIASPLPDSLAGITEVANTGDDALVPADTSTDSNSEKTSKQDSPSATDEDAEEERWPYPDRDDANSTTSKRAWWRRLGRGRERSSTK